MSTARGQRAGHLTPTAGGRPQRPAAEAAFVHGELGQVTAEAVTVGLPTLHAKTNVDIRGVGRKFSGLYYVEAVRHRIDGSGYSCELTLRRNALGGGAGRTAPDTLGKRNAQHAPSAAAHPASPSAQPATPSRQVVIDANTGRRR
ncbi:MAG TPA: hypothetical protein VGL77_18575 [Armatimonadota bacterium]